jgi:hypothetical protein
VVGRRRLTRTSPQWQQHRSGTGSGSQGGPCFQQYEPLPNHRRPGHRPRLTGFESRSAVLGWHKGLFLLPVGRKGLAPDEPGFDGETWGCFRYWSMIAMSAVAKGVVSRSPRTASCWL